MGKEPIFKIVLDTCLNIALKDNTIRFKKLTTSVSGRENLARPFIRQKYLSMSPEIHCPPKVKVQTIFRE